MEVNEIRGIIEWNGMEWKIVMTRVERKEGEQAGKRYRPTGGWAMRVSQPNIVPGILAEQVDQADRSWDS